MSRLTGAELFRGVDASVLEFWQWEAGDLRMNNTRGRLAEFLVAKAMGATLGVRREWDNYDVLYKDIRIEVKCSGYVQRFVASKKPSQIRYGGLIAQEYDWETGRYSRDRRVRCDVFV